MVKKRSKELVPFLFQSLYTSGMRWTMTGACLCCSPIRQTETLLSPGALVRTLITEMITNLDYRECESRLRPVCPELRRTKNDFIYSSSFVFVAPAHHVRLASPRLMNASTSTGRAGKKSTPTLLLHTIWSIVSPPPLNS